MKIGPLSFPCFEPCRPFVSFRRSYKSWHHGLPFKLYRVQKDFIELFRTLFVNLRRLRTSSHHELSDPVVPMKIGPVELLIEWCYKMMSLLNHSLQTQKIEKSIF